MAARASAFVAGMVLGVMLATGIMVSHADPAEADVTEAAAAANVDPRDLMAAVATVSSSVSDVTPWSYLRSTGELPPLPAIPPPGSRYSARVECIIRVESRGDPNARNRSGASGLGQFLPGTWASTPQGRAGLSVFNAAANRAAITWMLSVGRAREFVAVSAYGC